MSDVKWIQIATGIFDNRKIKQIERMPEGDAIIVVWIKLLCLAGTCNKNGLIYFTEEIPYTDDMLATEFGMEQPQRFNVLKLALATFVRFKMIEIIDSVYFISSWEKYQNTDALNKIREQTRLRVSKHRENKKVTCNVTVTDNVTQCNATDKEKEIEKDIYINTVQNDCTAKAVDAEIGPVKDDNARATKAEVEAFFESVWKLYPNKKGKGQVSDSKKEKLYKIGFSKLSIAISRYQQELNKDGWRQPQNGSTFFNSGYIDYLDGNYQPSILSPPQPKPPSQHQPLQSRQSTNKFNSFPQRQYSPQDYADMERKLINKSG